MTPHHEDDFADVRRLLDAVPAAAVPPPDVGAIYLAAADRKAKVARRWRACAGAAVALAAGVLVAAVLPKLEVKLDGREFAVRWGPADPPAPVVVVPPATTDPRVLARLDALEDRPSGELAQQKRIAELEDLLLTLAADVSDRDGRRRAEVAAVAAELRAARADARAQAEQTEKTNAAFYAAIFDKPRPGGKP